jgi:alpha-beta hydrolase superfamily lysophospholipase
LLNLGLTDTGICPGCTAHGGFNQAWLDAKSTVMAAVQSLASDPANAGFEIVVTGHSLGAAIATVAAADLRRTFKVDLVSMIFYHTTSNKTRAPL